MKFVLSMNPFVVTYRPINVDKYSLFILHYTMRLVWNELIERNINLMFSDDNVFRFF